MSGAVAVLVWLLAVVMLLRDVRKLEEERRDADTWAHAVNRFCRDHRPQEDDRP